MRKLLLAGAACLLSTGAMAAPLLSAGTINAGGLTFSGFTCTQPTPQGSTVGGCGNIDVQGTSNGLAFSTLLGTVAGGAQPPVSGLDVVIGYTVTSPTLLSSIGLTFNGAVAGSDGYARITEQAFTSQGGTLLGTAFVSTVTGVRQTTMNLNPSVFTAYIEKDIQLASFAVGALTSSTISTVGQTFPVPEPMSLALFGAGLLGLGVARRARKQA